MTTVISITHFVIVVLVLCVWGCAIFRWWSKLVCTFLLILSKGKISKLTDHLWRQVGQVFRALVLKSGGSPSCYSLDLFSGALRVQLLGCSLFIADWSASYQLGFFKQCVYGRLLCLFPISLNWLFERTAITPSGDFNSPRSLLDTLCFLFAFYLETFWRPCFCLFAHGRMCFLFWKKGKSCRLCCDHIEHLDFMDR